jgi:hypothetical protein
MSRNTSSRLADERGSWLSSSTALAISERIAPRPLRDVTSSTAQLGSQNEPDGLREITVPQRMLVSDGDEAQA